MPQPDRHAFGKARVGSVGRRACARVLLPRAVAAVACVLLLLTFAATPREAAASANANWGTGVEATPPANAGSNPKAVLSLLSCPSAGNCTAAGRYTDSSGHQQVFFLTETSGTWGTALEAAVPAGAAPNPEVEVGSLSCSSEGNCAVVGHYIDSSGDQQGVLWTETSGTWGTGLKAALPANAGSNPEVFLWPVSCPSAGNCTATGRYIDSSEHQQGLLLSETSGTWTTGVEATMPANADASGPGVFMNGLSCPSAGNCTAVGNYSVGFGDYEGFILTETSGTWGAGVEATPPADAETRLFLQGVSCPSAGNCAAVGDYFDSSGNNQGLLLSETSGVWGTGVAAPLPVNGASEPYVFINTVQCASAGNCTAVGDYIANSTQGEGLLLTETSGTWGTGVEAPVPANARTDPFVTGGSISCPAAGDCSVVSHYYDSASRRRGLLLTESSGTWGPGLEAALPANAGSNPEVSLGPAACTSPRNCTAVGDYSDASGHQQGLLLTAAPATPTLSASGPESGFAGDAISPTATLAAGSAPVGTVTFTVFGPQSSPPVSCTSGGTTVGAASVSSDGNYQPSTAFTPSAPGDYWWYAGYGGDAGDEPAASTCGPAMAETRVVPKATPTLAAAGPMGGFAGSPIAASSISATLAEGSSATGTVTFTVFGPQSSPPGSCASGGATVGTAGVSGDGSYQPSAGFTPPSPGDYWWYAAYGGDAGDNPAASACGPLMAETVVVAAAPFLSMSAPAAATAGSPIAASSVSATLAGGVAESGTVAFTVFGPQSSPPGSCASGGATVGTASVSGDGTYHPSGAFTPTSPGDYWWYARYGGDPSNEPAASRCGAATAETVVPAKSAPMLSDVKLGSRRFAAKRHVTLKLALSEPAAIKVLVTETVMGHKLRGACRHTAKTGKRCATTVRRRILTFSGSAGSNMFKLRLAGLRKGTYTATITAEDANGKSNAVRITFTITHR